MSTGSLAPLGPMVIPGSQYSKFIIYTFCNQQTRERESTKLIKTVVVFGVVVVTLYVMTFVKWTFFTGIFQFLLHLLINLHTNVFCYRSHRANTPCYEGGYFMSWPSCIRGILYFFFLHSDIVNLRLLGTQHVGFIFKTLMRGLTFRHDLSKSICIYV